MFFWYLLAFLIGASVATQSPLNAAATATVGVGPVLVVSNIIVLVGSIVIAGLWPTTAQWSAIPQVPLYQWGGALCGLTILVGGLLVFPKLGPTTALGLILIGQFSVALLWEQTGLLGVPRAPLDMSKIIGIALMLIGFLVTQYKHLTS